VKKLATLLFSLACASSAFGMLTKKFLSYKNSKPFYSTKAYKITPDHCPCFAQDCTCGEKKPKEETITHDKLELNLVLCNTDRNFTTLLTKKGHQ
jgi:hypothetical protein